MQRQKIPTKPTGRPPARRITVRPVVTQIEGKNMSSKPSKPVAEGLRYNDQICWETVVGQEIVKLVTMDRKFIYCFHKLTAYFVFELDALILRKPVKC